LGCGNDTRIAKIKDMGFTGHTLNKRPALVRGLMNDELQREMHEYPEEARNAGNHTWVKHGGEVVSTSTVPDFPFAYARLSYRAPHPAIRGPKFGVGLEGTRQY
jgi:hypothetical protein